LVDKANKTGPWGKAGQKLRNIDLTWPVQQIQQKVVIAHAPSDTGIEGWWFIPMSTNCPKSKRSCCLGDKFCLCLSAVVIFSWHSSSGTSINSGHPLSKVIVIAHLRSFCHSLCSSSICPTTTTTLCPWKAFTAKRLCASAITTVVYVSNLDA